MKISEEQLNRMIAFVGHGDFSNAKIIFFGNEEGTAKSNDQKRKKGKPLIDLGKAIDKRCNQYFIEGVPILPGNPEAGFYVMPQIDNFDNSPMLSFQARILLHLNAPMVDWFQTKTAKPARYRCIKEYQAYLLYKEPQPKIKSALVDLRPLPRSNENEWPYENLDRKQYIRAFSYGKQNNIDNDYLGLSLERSEVIKRLLNSSGQAKILIGIGAKEVKRRFLTQTFNNPHFDIIDLDNSQCYQTTLTMENGRLMHVYLCNFFNNRNFKLRNLKALADIIYPLI